MILCRCLLPVALVLATPVLAERVVVQALINDTEEVVLDPAYSVDASARVVVDSLFDPLLAWDGAGHLMPAQATSWEISPDQLVYTLHLKTENRWTDGRPVVAQDFVTAFRRFVNPETDERAVLRYLLDPVVNAKEIAKGEKSPDTLGIRAIDDRTLEITLVTPTSYFGEILAQPAMSPVPTHAFEKYGEAWAEPENLINNGPYRLAHFDSQKIVMQRNDDFRPRPEPDRLDLLFVKDAAELLKLLVTDRVDVVLTMAQKDFVTLQSRDWVKSIAVETSPGTTYLSINTTKAPFDDVRIRQAIDLAVDRDVLNRAQDEYTGMVATSFTPPSMFTYLTPPAAPPATPYPERLIRAKALLAEAGYDAANPLELELMRREASPQSQPVLVGVRSMLSQLPITVTISEVNRDMLLQRLGQKEFDVAILTWQADYNDPMTFLALFRSGGFANFSGWANPAYQDLLDKAMTTTDRPAREGLYLEAEALIRDDLPIIPLRHSSTSLLSSKNLIMPRLVNGVMYPRLIQFLNE